MRLKAAALQFEAANPRHAHEWAVWRANADKIPDDKILIPGVLDTTTNYIEHPELVAERLGRFVDIVGAERVMAGTDCGFGTWAGFGPIDPTICWAKLRGDGRGREARQRAGARLRREVRGQRAHGRIRDVLFPRLDDPSDRLALRFDERELTYAQLRDARRERRRPGRRRAARRRLGAVGARDGRGGRRRAARRRRRGADQPEGGRARARRTSSTTAPPRRSCARPASSCRRRSPSAPRVDVDLDRARRRPRARAGRGGTRARRLHLGHHRPAQGRRPAAPRDRLQPRRARRRVGVDGRRRGRPRAAALPRPRPGHRRPRADPPRRRRASPRALLLGGRRPRRWRRARR